ncbi:MAG: GNAT family N-acetyltransferase [Rhodobacteraceae bacterium]|nr:GNAT family N-acetyltransferase [Paracoccaceae bacterium]
MYKARQDLRRFVEVQLDRRQVCDGIIARLADDMDIPAMVCLNVNTIRSLGKDGLFMPQAETFFRDIIADGVAIVLEREGRVLGYSVAVPEGRRHPAFLVVRFRHRVGLLFGTALDPEVRRNGWQTWLIDVRLRAFMNCGYSEVQATVAPFNLPSLINLVDNSFHIAGLNTPFGGHLRFIVCHDLKYREQNTMHQSPVVDLELSGCLSRHQELLADGYRGIKVLRGATVTIRYAKFDHLET